MASQVTRAVDVIVIGAGPAGENVADRTTAAGLSTVIVESDLVGGECSYWACEPSKALLRPVLLRADAAHVPGVFRADGPDPLDVAAVLAHRDRMAAGWNDEGQVQWLESAGIELVRGHGRLVGPKQVDVTTREGRTVRLRARHAVAVCTGTHAVLPPLQGLDSLHAWTSREATSAGPRIPERLAIVGAGVVAVEMATAYQALGSQVTVIARGSGLLERMEPFAGELVTGRLREAGVDIRFRTNVRAAERPKGPTGEIQISLDNGSTLAADQLLFATGRAPGTEDLGLENVGLRPGDWLTTGDTFNVAGVPGDWLYAVGDVNHRALLTHQGKYQARIAGEIIAARALNQPLDNSRWGRHSATADTEALPQVVFTDPEVVTVGLTTAEARRRARRVDVVDYDLAGLGGAHQYRTDYQGQARILIDPARRTVVGATFVGPGVAELLHSATVAVTGEVTIERLWHAVPAFPTISEAWLRLLETYRG